MAKKKGVAPKITIMNGDAKVQPIPRDRNNTDDLNDAVEAVHSKHSHLRAPVGTLSKGVRTGSFGPTDNTAFNGNKVVTRKT